MILQTLSDYKGHPSINIDETAAIDEVRLKQIALESGLTVAQVESFLTHKITLDTGYYFDNAFSGVRKIVIWFRLELHEQSKKDYVERPRQGTFKARWGAPAYFEKYSNAALEIVKVASETYSRYTIRQMPADLVAKIIDRLHREIMSEWSRSD